MALVEVTLPYGSKDVTFLVSKEQLKDILIPNKVIPAKDENNEISYAIENPIGSNKLEKIVFGGKSVCIICDDISRSTPVDKVLQILLKKLKSAGVADNNIKIIMALGSHRYMTDDEIRKRVGNEVYSKYRVINHEFKDKSKLINLGEAPGGITIWANKEVVESDIRIGIGSIVPHPAVGWSGGGKIIYPGITGEDTVTQFHIRQGLSEGNAFGMDECPLRLEMEKWVDTVGLHFIINLILTPDKKVYKAVAGHYIKAQREGVKYSKEVYGVKASHLVDIAVVSSYPADADLWQAAKGFSSGDKIVRDGGTIILVSPCYEGEGPHLEHIDQIGNDKAEDRLLTIKAGAEKEGDILALAVGTVLSKMRRRKNIAIISDGLDEERVKAGKMMYFKDIQSALNSIQKMYEYNSSISVIPFGGETCAYLSGDM